MNVLTQMTTCTQMIFFCPQSTDFVPTIVVKNECTVINVVAAQHPLPQPAQHILHKQLHTSAFYLKSSHIVSATDFCILYILLF